MSGVPLIRGRGGSAVFCLVAQLTVMLLIDKSMPVYFSRPFLLQNFSLTLNQMHVVVFSDCFLRTVSEVSWAVVPGHRHTWSCL